jgi:hypothetical protein
VIEHWKDVAVPAGAKSIRKVGNDRRRLIVNRITAEGLSDVLAAIDRISKSTWATGGADGTGFRANLNWFLRPGKINAILEGNHDDFSSNRQQPSNRGAAEIAAEQLAQLPFG